jgi:hypothetical protein
LAFRLSSSNIALSSLLLSAYSPLAPMYYPSCPTFPVYFVFPTGSIGTWWVFCDWFDDVTCASTAGPYRPRRQPPGNPRIIRAVHFEPADVNCVVDRHIDCEV